jgi:hypothetical protein
MKNVLNLVIFPVVCLSLLNACVVRVTSTDNPPAPPAPTATSGNLVNVRLNLPAYPGSQILDVDTDSDGSSKVRFASNASIDAVNGFFHSQLGARGWQRTRFEQKGAATKVEATYARQGSSFKYDLDRQGNSGRYSLEIDFDN